MRSAAAEPKQGEERASRLADLLACEKELAQALEATRAEARKLVEAARAESERASVELTASLDETSGRARREIEDAARARAQAFLEDACAQAARFDGIPDEEVARLADLALRRLLGRA